MAGEIGKQENGPEDAERQPWEKLGIPENASKEEAMAAVNQIARRVRMNIFDPDYVDAYNAYNEMFGTGARARSPENSSPEPEAEPAQESTDSRFKKVMDVLREDGARLKKLVENPRSWLLATIVGSTIIGGYAFKRGLEVAPPADSPAATSTEEAPEPDDEPISKTVAKPKKAAEKKPARAYGYKFEEPAPVIVLEKQEDSKDVVFPKDEPAATTETKQDVEQKKEVEQKPTTILEKQEDNKDVVPSKEQPAAEPKKDVQPEKEAEQKQEIIPKDLEIELLEDFVNRVGHAAQSEGNGNFLIDFGADGCYRVKPNDLRQLGNIERAGIVKEKKFARPGKFSKSRLENDFKKDAGVKMRTFIRKYCEKIPHDQVKDAMEKAKEMQKKADEQRENVDTKRSSKPTGYDRSTAKEKRERDTRNANSRYNPRDYR